MYPSILVKIKANRKAKIYMNQKKLIQIAVIIVLGVWIGCASYFISAKVADKPADTTVTLSADISSQATDVSVPDTSLSPATTEPSATAPTTTEPVTSQTTLPVATVPSTKLNIDGNNIVTTAPQAEAPAWQQAQQAEQSKQDAQSSFQAVKDSIPNSTEEIIEAYVKGVNNLKNAKSFSMHKDDKLNIKVDDMTGGTMVKAFADQLIASNQKKPVDYVFENGIDAATGKTPMDAIAPLGASAALTANDIKDARSVVTDNQGSYAVKIALKDEHQVYPADAPAHSKIVEVVDVSALLISGMNIDELDILYSGTTIEANFDKDGRITSMTHYLPVTNAEGKGRYAMINAQMKLHGDFTSVYTFTY